MNHTRPDLLVKAALVGDYAVGKTSLFRVVGAERGAAAGLGFTRSRADGVDRDADGLKTPPPPEEEEEAKDTLMEGTHIHNKVQHRSCENRRHIRYG